MNLGPVRVRNAVLEVAGRTFSSIHGYQRRWLRLDLLAGLTLLAIAIPEQLATSRLAGMPPITGYYAFIAGTLLFAALGSNPQMSVGADSTIAPLFAVAVGHLAATGSPRYVALVGLLAVCVGVIVALVGLLRFGWIAEFLSAPIITGFLAGVAVIIVVHQLPAFLGIPAAQGSNLHRISQIFDHLGATNGWTVGIGAAVLAVVVSVDRLDRRLPGALAALVGSILIVALAHLHSHGVAVLGTVQRGAPHFGLSQLSWSSLGDILPIAAVVAIVVISQSAATTRAFAAQGRYEVNVGRDFIGVGAGSVLAGLAGSFPVDASPPRTAAVASAGGRTQVAGLSAAVALALLISAAGLLEDLPLATLAAILLFVAGRLVQVRVLWSIGRFNLVELGLAVVTLLTVVLVGIEQGIGLAVALAILDRVRLSARPQLHVLGRIPGTTSWAPLSSSEQPQQERGVLVVLFATPLWYANEGHFRAQLEAAFHRAVGTVQLVVLDAIGMSDVDFTGARCLGQVLDSVAQRGAVFAVARSGEHMRDSLTRSGLAERIGPDHFFASVNEAVAALHPQLPDT